MKADDIFQPDVLQAVENLTADAEVLEGVTRVVSLTTVTNVRGQDGILNVDRLLPYVPTKEEGDELKRIRDDALYNEILLGEVISRDGKTAAVNLFVADTPEDKQFNEDLTEAVQKMIDRELENLVERAQLFIDSSHRGLEGVAGRNVSRHKVVHRFHIVVVAVEPGLRAPAPDLAHVPVEVAHPEQVLSVAQARDVLVDHEQLALSPQCGFSSRVASILHYMEVTFKDVNVLDSDEMRQGIKIFSDWPTTPQLYVKGEFVGGCDIVTEMTMSGELDKVFGDSDVAFNKEAAEAIRKQNA